MNQLKKKPVKSLVLAAFVAVYLIWGSTYLGIYLAIETIPPFYMAAARFLVAGLILFAYARFKGERLPNRVSMSRIALAGFLLLFMGNGGVTWVEQYLPSGLVAIIVAAVPLWFVLIDKRQWSYHFSNRQIVLGLCIGFAGVIVLFAGQTAADIMHDRMKLISLIVLITGNICWAVGSLYAKYKPIEGSTIMKVALQMITAGIVCILAALITGEKLVPSHITWESAGALFYLIIFGSIVAYLSYMWLLSVRPASIVGTYAYVNPVVAVFLGWLVAGEHIGLQQLLGLGVILLGLIVVNMAGRKP